MQDQIELKQYQLAIDQLCVLLNQSIGEENKDLLSMVLDLVNTICDKTNETIENTIENIKALLDHPDDWVRLEALTILKKIFTISPDKFSALIDRVESKLYQCR